MAKIARQGIASPKRRLAAKLGEACSKALGSLMNAKNAFMFEECGVHSSFFVPSLWLVVDQAPQQEELIRQKIFI